MEQTKTPSDTTHQQYRILERELGRRLSTKEVAAYLGLDEDTARKYYQEIGGIRPTGPKGRILFFERNVVSALKRKDPYANEDEEEWTDSMESQSAEGQESQDEIFRHKKGGVGLGSRGKTEGLVDVDDRHGILDE